VKDDQKLPDELRFHTIHWVCKHHGVYKTRSTGKRHNVRSFAVGCPVQITVWYASLLLAFFVAGACIWNDLSSNVTSSPSLLTYKQRLKMHLFCVAPTVPQP